MKVVLSADHESYYPLCFDTLSNELRVRILHELKSGEESVEDLAQKLGVERSRLSHALTPLLECQYVTVKKKGKHRFYALNEKVLKLDATSKNLFEAVDSHISGICQHECKRMNH